MLTRPLGPPHRRPGIALIKVCICLASLIAILALNMDGGRMMDERRHAQSTADSAALAAAASLYKNYWTYRGLDHGNVARTAAEQVAAANGYPASAVTVQIPPTTGPYAGQAGHVEVTVGSSLRASFGKVFTGHDLQVRARAVARGEPLKLGIVLLRSTGAGAFNCTAPAFALVSKPLIVNSNDPAAFQSTTLVFASLSRIDVTGGVSNSNLLSITTRVRTGVRPTLDPLASLPIPGAGAPVRSSTPKVINNLLPLPIETLQPGVYKGGIQIKGSSTVVMNPGVYVMEGGGFQISELATVTGAEVMVYNTTGSTYPAGPIAVTGLGKVVMGAPVSGTYQGLNFFQNRGLTQPVSITGAGLTVITGTVYAAKAPVNLTGTLAVGLDIRGGAYVADSMNVGGLGAVTVDLGYNPPRVPDVRIVD